jgi:hypothetical protein
MGDLMGKVYEVIFKHDQTVVLTLNNFLDWTSAMDAIKTQQDKGLTFDNAVIFEVQGSSRYLVNTESTS